MAALEPFDRLGRHVARQQSGLIEPGPDHARLKAELLAQATGAAPRRPRAPLVLGLAAGLAAAAITAYLARPATRDLSCFIGAADVPTGIGAWISAPAAQPLKVRFSDGTRASLWPEARARLTRLSPYGADVVVEQGRASFNVVHQVRAHWLVSTGPFVVQVTGTRFDVEWQPEKDRFELVLYEGRVRVTGCALGDGQELSAGHRIVASCARNDFRISALGETSAASELPAATVANSAVAQPELEASPDAVRSNLARPAIEPATKPAGAGSATVASKIVSQIQQAGSGPDHWLALAHGGRFSEAYDAAVAAGFDGECLSLGAAEVSLLGDAARLSGHLDRANRAYQAVRRRWPGSTDAALAAFQMGRAAFDQSRDYASAEGWLRTYLSERPNGEFGSPALGRLMEAEVRLGRYESAHTLAASYLDRYPGGSHADAAHRVLDAHPANAR